MGPSGGGHVSHDVTPIHKVRKTVLAIILTIVTQVDDEDLPTNMESMEQDELQCVAASYGIDFDDKADVKVRIDSWFLVLIKIPFISSLNTNSLFLDSNW